jgi:signal transduction histidine kinase
MGVLGVLVLAAAPRVIGGLRLHDEFLAVAGHELKTPITSALASAQLIARQVDKGTPLGPARLRDRLQIIGRQVGKLGRLTAQLVDIG